MPMEAIQVQIQKEIHIQIYSISKILKI